MKGFKWGRNLELIGEKIFMHIPTGNSNHNIAPPEPTHGKETLA
jgi:hypothetical protein